MNHALTLPAQATALTRDTRQIFRLLENLRHGELSVRLPDGASYRFGSGEQAAHLDVHDAAMFGQVLARGDIGLAESYLDGQWDSPDVTGLLTLLANNRDCLRRAVYGAWPSLLAAQVRHWLNGNSRAGSKRNIMAHYDLGNDFYRLWLDDTMTYSAALFDGRDTSLEVAQVAKYLRILEQLQARPGERVLEIGCGWGGFAEIAQTLGLQLTGLTLSPAQLAWARTRVPGVDFRLQDYRDTTEQFDHIVSIEMFEAVGERWWPSYFSTVARALKPGGRAVIQSIVIRDDLFSAYRRGTDFIQQYVFPGGMLPSPSVFKAHAARAGLQVTDTHAFGRDYARTLELWRQTFEARWPEIQNHGFDERFRRLWRMYLCYCEAGFLAGNVDVMQFTLAHEPA